uniref:isocitrate/isopropylmalate family dehydrogenase n=1 Tax=Enterovirga sp. TaxID=2026350 RepID=UPI002BCFD370
GMLPPAPLGAPDARGHFPSVFEPVHGSAPDIAGQGLANPLAMIGSLAMALRYSLGLKDFADKLEAAIGAVLASGARTRDIASPGANAIGTGEMGDAVAAALKPLLR